jgi:FkbM family methyltransferase
MIRNLVTKFHKSYISLISLLLWQLESIFFYPKLRKVYRTIFADQSPISEKNKSNEKFIVFDIGANKGQSVSFFKKLFPDSYIYAFEPQKGIFEKLQNLVHLKSYINVETFNVGISSKNGQLILHEYDLDETSSFNPPAETSDYLKKKNLILLKKLSSKETTSICEVLTLDYECDILGIPHISILKIDVEGHEYDVLKGGSGVLGEKRVSVIQIERHLNDMRNDQSAGISDLLMSFGYSKISSIKHPFGTFYDDIYSISVR